MGVFVYGSEMSETILTKANSKADIVYGYGGNDVMMDNGGLGGEGNYFDGGAGVDTVKYAGNFSDYLMGVVGTVANVALGTNPLNAYGSRAQDGLVNVERIEFADKKFAIDWCASPTDLDYEGTAGRVARLIAAVFDEATLSNKEYVGIGLRAFDAGMTYSQVAGMAIQATGLSAPADIVDLLWTNIVGSHPSAGDAQPYVDMLNNGMAVSDLVILAAETPLNEANIHLVGQLLDGLVNGGLEYV